MVQPGCSLQIAIYFGFPGYLVIFLFKTQPLIKHRLRGTFSISATLLAYCLLFTFTMKIAVSTWQDQLSNVFDFAGFVLLAELAENKETQRHTYELYGRTGIEKAAYVRQLGADVLICGAISQPAVMWLSRAGIEVVPYVTGPVDEVLSAYLSGTLHQPRFSLPGCGGKGGGCRARRRGHRQHKTKI